VDGEGDARKDLSLGGRKFNKKRAVFVPDLPPVRTVLRREHAHRVTKSTRKQNGLKARGRAKGKRTLEAKKRFADASRLQRGMGKAD